MTPEPVSFTRKPNPQQRRSRAQPTPEKVAGSPITSRDLEILAAVERYRFVPTSFLLRLVPGSQQGLYRRLRVLFDKRLLQRVNCTPSDEQIYYLDSIEPLALLVQRPGATLPKSSWQVVRNNRQKDYARAFRDGHVGSLLFLQHELTIARFRFMVEKAAAASQGRVELTKWRQGPELWNWVETPRVARHRTTSTPCADLNRKCRVPHRPDAFFTLRFPPNGAPARQLHFFYEADRKTTSLVRFKHKLKAHFDFIVYQRRQLQETYGVDRITAVLIETLDEHWAEALRQAARDWVVSGGAPSSLFWFTPSDLFTRKVRIMKSGRSQTISRYLVEPEAVFSHRWATPLTNWSEHTPKLHSLLDA